MANVDAVFAVTAVFAGFGLSAWLRRRPTWRLRRRARLLIVESPSSDARPDLVLPVAVLLARQGHRAEWLASVFGLPVAVTRLLVEQAKRRPLVTPVAGPGRRPASG